MNAPQPPGRTKPIYKFHWHVALTHFPVSLFAVTFGFQALNLFYTPDRLALAGDIALIAGTAVLVPVVVTGWTTWKGSYKGARIMLFQRKIAAAFAMLAVALPLAVWRGFSLGSLEAAPGNPEYWLFMFGVTLLISGAIVQGYYGGRLNHR